jgi:Protein of unknown function (DUF2924)
MPDQTPVETAINIEAALLKISRFSIEELRSQWQEIFGKDPPKAFGPDLLRRSIAQELQENAYGGPDQITKHELDRQIRLLSRTSTKRMEVPRRIKAGAVLVREWKGKTHRVMVLNDGFEYDGHAFSSLSEIAREITGTRWNGPRFFGLRVMELAISSQSDRQKSDGHSKRQRGKIEPPRSLPEQHVTTEATDGL